MAQTLLRRSGMVFIHRLSVLLIAGAPLLGCGPTNETECSSACDDAPEPIVLCNGTDSLRFSGTHAGGNLNGVPRVAEEVGWSFLLIAGTCQYWAMTGPDGPIRTGSLDASTEAALITELELGSWGPDHSAVVGCADAGGTRLRFLEDEINVSCASTVVTDAYDDWLETLHANGTQVIGEARYSLVDASDDGWVVGNNTGIAAPWPLAAAPAELLVDPAEEESAEPHLASLEEADALRAARDAYATRRMPSVGPWLRIPVVHEATGAGPRYFNLAVRDQTPFEQNGRLAPDDFF